MSDEKHLEKVECFYKTMTRRDPHKRQVKLVKPHLLQLDFAALGESSDDSDFKLNSEDNTDDEDAKSGKEAASSAHDSSSGSSSDSKSSDDDDEDDENDENQNNDNNDNIENNKDNCKSNESEDLKDGSKLEDFEKNALSDGTSVTKNSEVSMTGDNAPLSTASKSPVENKLSGKHNIKLMQSVKPKVKVHICCICLETSSSSSNEIIECDGCHITVHEECMGVSDSQSISSSDSSSSMEPWFCDACKADVKPNCELCPNVGGLFKETDSGRWVHLVCALYTSGVAFGDVERLSNVTLFEMPYTRWGSKECSLCEDRRFCRSGVCISCDAGMCRTHFHVTCGQKEGLLAEAAPDEEIADPFFAYCRQHAERQRQKVKRRHWSMLDKNIRQALICKRTLTPNQVRGIERKLKRHQTKHMQAKKLRSQCWVPDEKLPRLMLSSPYILKQLFRKAELQGVVEHHPKASNKKGTVNPGFHSHFVNYYIERNGMVDEVRRELLDKVKVGKSLSQQEDALKINISSVGRESDKMYASMVECREEWCKLVQLLELIHGQKISFPASLQANASFMERKINPRPSTKDSSAKAVTEGETEDGVNDGEDSKRMKLRGKHLLKETTKFAIHQQRVKERSRRRDERSGGRKKAKMEDTDRSDMGESLLESSFTISSEDSNDKNSKNEEDSSERFNFPAANPLKKQLNCEVNDKDYSPGEELIEISDGDD